LSLDLIFESMRVSVILVAFLCFISSCKDWEYPQKFPIVLTEKIVNVNPNGAELHGCAESLGSSQDIISYGFVWSESEMPTLNSSYISISDNIHKGAFFKTINYDLASNKVYYVRAFVQTNSIVVYGNQVIFTSQGSLPPKIIDFAPKKGFDGTEIIIKGQNFSPRLERNLVQIGTLNCQVISATDSLLKIKSPITNLVGDYKISITVAGKLVVSETEYSILGPRIRSISKLSGRVGDLLTIDGEYFDIGNSASISFGTPDQWISNESYPYVLSPNRMECYVPDYSNFVGKLELHSSSNSGQKDFVFPNNFSIVNSWDKISDSTPLESNLGYSSVQVGNSIFVIGGRTLYEFNGTVKTWTKKADFPGAYRFYGEAFSVNGELYYGFGEGRWEPPSCCENGQYFNDLWKYDPNSNSWNFIGNSPISKRSRMVSIVINNKAYIGLGWISWPSVTSFNDLWEFDVFSNSWNEITIPVGINGNSSLNATSFVINNKGYFVGVTFSGVDWDRHADVWEFDPAVPSWTKKSDYPDMIYGEVATTINNHGLVLSSAINDSRSRVYEYDPIKDRWIKRQSMSGTIAPIQFSHYLNGVLYYASGNLWGLTFN
jgi:N-acetylneuraminic acid mutarotase